MPGEASSSTATATAKMSGISDDQLDILGQQPSLKIYTQICFCFRLGDAASHSTILETLNNGLERLAANFPWIAGQVVTEAADEGNPSIVRFRPLEKTPRLIVKDLSNDPSAPTMEALRKAEFPMAMLDESIICPMNTIPGLSDHDIAPVFLIQATFITGGLILSFVGHHATMDMTGQGQVIDLFQKACYNQPFTDEELSSGNLARHNLIPFLDDSYSPGPELENQIIKPAPAQITSEGATAQAAPSPPPQCSWAYFTFNSESLSALKSLATRTIPDGSKYVSTDDTLSAFVWQSIMRARLPRLDPNITAKFARAVDVRRYLNVPSTYTGLFQNMTYHQYPLHQLIEEPLGSIASDFRSAIDPATSDLAWRTRALATFFRRSTDRSKISVTASLDLSTDIMLSSWARLDCYELDFNLGLGKPESVRRPRFVPVESLIYLLPKSREGDITVAICLRDEDMERLKADEEFRKHAKFIG